MGFIRGLLVVFISIVLILSVLASSIFFTISSSLDYKNVQGPEINALQPIIAQLNLVEIINSKSSYIVEYCKTNSDFVYNYQNYTLHFPCQDANNTSLILNDTINNFVSDSYHQHFDCGYWDCFEKYSPEAFLISEKSHDYWSNLFYIALAAAVVSGVALIFLFKKKYDLLFLLGVALILSAFLISGIGKLITSLANQLLSSFSSIFFSQINSVFWKLIIAGGILIIAGLVVELFRVGFKIYDMFSRFRKGGEDARKVKQPQKKKK